MAAPGSCPGGCHAPIRKRLNIAMPWGRLNPRLAIQDAPRFRAILPTLQVEEFRDVGRIA